MSTRALSLGPPRAQGAGRHAGRVISEGPGYQVLAARGSKDTILMLRSTPASKLRAGDDVDVQAKVLAPFEFGGEAFFVSVFPGEATPVRVADLASQTK